MAKRVVKPLEAREMPPAMTPEARENQMISLAVDAAEQQLRDGTAPTPIICHYLKLATKREKLERERLEEENKLLRAKTEALQQNGRTEEAINNAINAFKRYSGHGDEVEDDCDQYDDY